MFNVYVDIREIRKAIKILENYFNNIGSPNISTTMEDFGVKEVDEIQDRLLTTKKDPFGKSWAQLSDDYAEWKISVHGSTDIGILTGEMVNSFSIVVSKVKDTQVTISNDIWYSYNFNYGLETQPRRPFLKEYNIEKQINDIEVFFGKAIDNLFEQRGIK